MTLGLGSYIFRWSIGHKGLNPDVPLQPADLLDIAAQHGLALVQYADNMPLGELSDSSLAALRAKADGLGIAIELGTQSFIAAEVSRYIEVAGLLGARLLRVALDGPDAQIPVTELAASFKALLPQAEIAGVRIAIENHFNFPTERMVLLLDAIGSDRVGVCLDVANSICAGEWPKETVARLAPHTINLHLKDYLIVPDAYGVGFVIHGCPLGQGRSDCQAVLAALAGRPDVNVILEHWLPRTPDMQVARAHEHEWLALSVAYARQTLGL